MNSHHQIALAIARNMYSNGGGQSLAKHSFHNTKHNTQPDQLLSFTHTNTTMGVIGGNMDKLTGMLQYRCAPTPPPTPTHTRHTSRLFNWC